MQQHGGGGGGAGATPERLPSFLLSGPMTGSAGSTPAQALSPPASMAGGGGSGGSVLFGGAASPPTAITFNERLRAGGGTTPRRGTSLTVTPGRMPPSRSLLDGGGVPAVVRASPATPARTVARGTERWVTVFGFAATLEATVVREFRRHGDIIRTVAGRGNWVHLMYATSVNAQVALHKQWRTIAQGTIMVGVVPCTEPDIALNAEAQVERGILSASPSAPSVNRGTPMAATPSPSPAHRALRTPSSILRRESTPAATPAGFIRTPQPQKGIFGYLADLYG